MGHVLGEGGTGVVREARDPVLGRTLAVKQLKDDARRRPGVTASVLAEARVTGRVAHPFVVPVHDVRVDPAGNPEIVLKRIQGRPWGRLLREPAAVNRLHDRRDTLVFHIEVLEKVCQAVHAAHAQGIIHRDLKPGNIMIGRHAEVYVLDWGLGVAVHEDADSALPRPSRTGKASGTPQYMAPEMVSARFGALGPWSDVYLLGGLLFHVLFGRAPHQGADVWQMLLDVCERGVEVPEEGPPELITLCRHCLQRQPQDRPPDAEQVRRRLRTWLDHRPSVALCEEGATQTALLDGLWTARQIDEERRLHERFGAACFVFQRALDIWPENEDARRALLALVEKMVERELTLGRPNGADGALAWLNEVPGVLAKRVQAARTQQTLAETRRGWVSRWIGPEGAYPRLVAALFLILHAASVGLAVDVGLSSAISWVALSAGLASVVAVTLGNVSSKGRQAAAWLALGGAAQALVAQGAVIGGWTPEQTSTAHLYFHGATAGVAFLGGVRWLQPAVLVFFVAVPAAMTAPAAAPWLLQILAMATTAALSVPLTDRSQG
jgi:serine/threonine-protein kinase